MTYSPEIEHSMRMFHDSLSEKDRRRYAAIEATKLGHGGTEYISTLLGCDPKTIRQGRHDLDQLPDGLDGRVRKKADRPGVWGGAIHRRNPPREAEIRRFCSQSSW
jgi:hypothetical protein